MQVLQRTIINHFLFIQTFDENKIFNLKCGYCNRRIFFSILDHLMYDVCNLIKKLLLNLMIYLILNNTRLDKFKIKETTNIYEFFVHVFILIKINPGSILRGNFHIHKLEQNSFYHF
jgi:hypothetical protein